MIEKLSLSLVPFVASSCIKAASGPRRFACSTSSPRTNPPSPAWSTRKAACTSAWSAAPWQSTPDHKVCVTHLREVLVRISVSPVSSITNVCLSTQTAVITAARV